MGGTSRWQRRDGLAGLWCRAVVVRGVGPCGGADLEELPGREEYGEIKKVPSAGMVCQLQVIGKHATERLQGL